MQLESSVKMWNGSLSILNEGVDFYSSVYLKLNDLQNKIEDFLYARNVEKDDLLKNVVSGTNIELGGGSTPNYLDPQQNRITTMNYQYRYNPNGNNYKKI